MNDHQILLITNCPLGKTLFYLIEKHGPIIYADKEQNFIQTQTLDDKIHGVKVSISNQHIKDSCQIYTK